MVAVLLEAAVLLGLFLFMQFLRVRVEYKFCIKYSFFTKHIFNITSCSFKKEGIVTECNMNFRNYSLPDKLNELVERHFHDLFKKEELAGWLEELLDANEFLELFRDEVVKEMHYIGMKAGDVISFCG